MSTVQSWNKYLDDLVTTFREYISSLDLESREKLKSTSAESLLTEPCQIELLYVANKNVLILLVVHDKDLPDKLFKIQPDLKSLDESEFLKKYKFSARPDLEYILPDSTHVFSIHTETISDAPKDSPPDKLAKVLWDFATHEIRSEKINSIGKSTSQLIETIERVPQAKMRAELLATTKRIDETVKEIRRLDQSVDKVRKLIGTSTDFQDWRVLIADVERLNREHVPREVFESNVKEINGRIDSLSSVKEAYDKVLQQQSKLLEQQSSFITWIKYATIGVPIAIVLVPVIELLVRHALGIP